MRNSAHFVDPQIPCDYFLENFTPIAGLKNILSLMGHCPHAKLEPRWCSWTESTVGQFHSSKKAISHLPPLEVGHSRIQGKLIKKCEKQIKNVKNMAKACVFYGATSQSLREKKNSHPPGGSVFPYSPGHRTFKWGVALFRQVSE